MTSRERVLTALSHQEPDRVPFDLGGMAQSGIHRVAYANLCRQLGFPQRDARLLNVITQAARLNEDFQERLAIDTQLVYGRWASPQDAEISHDGDYLVYYDEWMIGRRMPAQGGLYFDVFSHPFDVDDVDERWASYVWPDPLEPERFTGLRQEAALARASGRFVVLMGLCPGIVEMYSWLRGFRRFYEDLAAEPDIVERFLQKMAALKIAYWQRALELVGDCVDAVNEADDVAGQTGMLLSPASYRRLIKPHHQAVLSAIRQAAPHVKMIMHSCGAVRDIIPDFIEMGVDVLNPVQISADGMKPAGLKRDFGARICFWGGGVDTQQVLGVGPAGRIREDVRRNIAALAPGGGYVFSAVHIIQANVPPENVMVMWDTLRSENRGVGK